MRRRHVLATSVFCLPFLATAAMAEPVTITFLHTNDIYEISPDDGQGGFGELATLLERERAANPLTVTTFGGDLFSPSVMSGLTKGEQMVELLNAIGTDVAVVGNHEFDFGADIAAERFAASSFPWLGGNALDASGEPAIGMAATHMMEIGGYRIGFLGVIAEETPTLSSPGPDITFVDAEETAASLAAGLREQGADLVIAMTHLDEADDRELLRRVDDIDIALGGHDHDPITFFDGSALLIKAGYDAQYLAAVDITLDRVDKRGEEVVVWRPQWRFLSTAGIEPEPGIQAIVDRWNGKLDEELNVPVGEAGVALDTRRGTVRSEESNFGNLIAEAMMNATGADVGFTNGGGIRGDRTYDPGTVLTRKDVLSELPFGNVTVLMELGGADLLDALENGVSQFEDGAGRFPQVAGMTFRFDAGKPAGSRVSDVTVGGEPLDPARSYKVATNDYIASGGDGYEALTRGRLLIDASGATLMASTVMNYITALGGSITQETDGRITRID